MAISLTPPPIRRCAADSGGGFWRRRPGPVKVRPNKGALMRAGLAVLGWLMAAGAAAAHPHVFVDTGLEILLDDQNRATGVRISWTYDDLTSLQLIADRGLDEDFDGVLTPEEEAAILGFDMNWPPGVAGDTYALLGETPLDWSGPQEVTVAYADAKLTSSHLRRFAQPVELGAQPLIVQAYDTSYYTAYAVVRAVVSGGQGNCSAEIFAPEASEANEVLRAAMAELSPTDDAEALFPAVGAAFAEEARVTCAAP